MTTMTDECGDREMDKYRKERGIETKCVKKEENEDNKRQKRRIRKQNDERNNWKDRKEKWMRRETGDKDGKGEIEEVDMNERRNV